MVRKQIQVIKTMKNCSIVITSIYPNSPAIKDFIKLGYKIILIGDTKTPFVKTSSSLLYFPVSLQERMFKEFSKHLPRKHYSRKNIGYLIAMRNSTAIIETDDDNFPNNFFPNFQDDEIKTTLVGSANHFVNTYKLFSRKKDVKIWPRGFPLALVNDNPSLQTNSITDIFPLQQSLINGDSDFDAIYRLTDNSPVEFKNNYSFAIKPHTFAPINTQNTFWKKEAFLLMYLPSFISSRVCDIYRGYIAQRLLWEKNRMVLFLSPSVYQKRNPHNLLNDFEQEMLLFTRLEKFIAVLESVKLTGTLENKMIQVYQALIAENLLEKKELGQVKRWIKIVSSLLKKGN